MRFVVPAAAIAAVVPLQYLAPALLFAGLFGLDRSAYAKVHALGKARVAAS